MRLSLGSSLFSPPVWYLLLTPLVIFPYYFSCPFISFSPPGWLTMRRALNETRRVIQQRAIIVRNGLLAHNVPRIVTDRRSQESCVSTDGGDAGCLGNGSLSPFGRGTGRGGFSGKFTITPLPNPSPA